MLCDKSLDDLSRAGDKLETVACLVKVSAKYSCGAWRESSSGESQGESGNLGLDKLG